MSVTIVKTNVWNRSNIDGSGGAINLTDVEALIKLAQVVVPAKTPANLIYGTHGETDAEYSFTKTGYLVYSGDVDDTNNVNLTDVEKALKVAQGVSGVSIKDDTNTPRPFLPTVSLNSEG